MADVAWSDFVDDIKEAVFPEGEAENLVANHDRYVLNGIIDLQLKVDCLQVEHEDRTIFNDTWYHCGASVFTAPRGYIQELSTVTTADCCDKVKYRPTTKGHIDCMIAEVAACEDIDQPYGYYLYDGLYLPYADTGLYCTVHSGPATDKDCRATDGWFTLYRGELWVYPHIDSNESIMLTWDGLKRAWAAGDLIDDDPDVRQALELYLAYTVALREDCDREKYLVMKAEYDNKVADMMWDCAREKRLPRREPCFNNCG